MMATARLTIFLVMLILGSCRTAGQPDHDVSEYRLRRPEGIAAYRLDIVEDDGSGAKRTTLYFMVTTSRDGTEWIRIDSAIVAGRDSVAANVTLDESCRRAFGAIGEELGGFTMKQTEEIGTMVPPCVPEHVFGAITDAVAILTIQYDSAFGIDRLEEGAARARFDGFDMTWRRPPELLEARLAAAAGNTSFVERNGDTAVIEWAPDSMRLALLRSMNGSGTVLMAGTEHLRLRLGIDSRTGTLIGGASSIDRLDMTMWYPAGVDSIPAFDRLPTRPGMRVRIERRLRLERL